MKILVINAGSSSLKYQLIDMKDESVIAKGLCERIGVDGRISHKAADGRKCEYDVSFPTHKQAFEEVVKVLSTGDTKVIDSMSEISAVGHRVLHGAEVYKVSTLVDDKVIDTVMELKDLGPLHNPPQAIAMKACQEVFGKDTPMVAVFDTSFHQTMPEKAYIFGVPYEYYEKYHIRRYGFHGTSHRYVGARMAEVLGKKPEDLKIISCHLGNGSSITAIDGGNCVDTTMGFTPLDGFIMGTRSGAVDPSVITFIMDKENMSAQDMASMLNKKSGFLGLSGVSSDCREIEQAAAEGNHRAEMTLDIVKYQIKKQIAAYAAAMGGVDVILFTGGIGENSAYIREKTLAYLPHFGFNLSKEQNDNLKRGTEGRIDAGTGPQIW
ncbi:MAG: acetate kinase, partial [Oscillospiraceae bacterium]